MADSSPSRWDVPVEGMSCVNCAGRVERGLQALPGAKRVRVDLATHTATVEGDVGLADLVEAVDKAGYTVTTRVVDLPVAGMDCASCVGRVDEAVGALPGVLVATARLAEGLVTVRYVPGLVSVPALVEAVRSAGYDVPVVPTEGEDPESIAADIHRRELRGYAARLAVALPAATLFMVDMVVPEVMASRSPLWSMPVQFVLATLVVFFAGWPFLHGAWKAARAGAADMNSLIAIGSLAAWAFSTAMWISPHTFGHDGSHLYYDAAVEIVALILLGRLLEAWARQRTGSALRELVALRPTAALRIEDGDREVERPIEALAAGDRIAIPVGARVPVDGVVSAGRSAVDASALTGESLPVDVEVGSEIAAGVVNLTSRLELRATRVGSETTLSRMIRLVRDAQGSRAPIQRLADRVSAIFVPVVIVVAVTAGLVWTFVGPEPRVVNGVIAFVTVLIISCPCALGLATPTAVVVGVGRGAKRGILFKQAAAVERLDRIDVVVFDKTGTLTYARPELQRTILLGAADETSALAVTATLEQASRHPMATGIVRAAVGREISPTPTPTDAKETAGFGITATVGGRRHWAGRPEWVSREAGHALPEAALAEFDAAALTPVALADEGGFLALFGLADPIRDEAVGVLADLRRRGIRTVLLTGDRRAAAARVAEALGINEVRAGLLPQDKLEAIRALQAEGRRVMMLGDGINDAPSLAGADIGVAMGAGSDIAAEAGDIVLVRDRLDDLPRALRLGRATMRTIRQNLFLSFFYNAIAIPVAAGVLYPHFGLRLEPWMAAAAMALSDVSVIGNSLRLKWRRL